MCSDQSASLDGPFLDFSNVANARPAVLFHAGEVFQAFEIGWDIGSFLLCSLFANGEGFIDVIDASDLKVMGAIVGLDEHN